MAQQPSETPPWMKFEVGGVAGLGQTKSDQTRKVKSQAKKKDAAKGGSSDGDGDEEGRAKGKMISKFFATELRQKRKLMGHLGAPGKEEIYCDKDRAAAVAMGDQDIKTSLKVKRKKERKTVQPEDTNSSVHMTEALRAISKGNVETALSCAEKAVEGCQDPGPLVVRGRCHLLLGHLQQALEDARTALKADPTLVKAVLVQAEALYGMGEFERSLVLFHRGARKRPDLTAFKRGVHKAREAIINAIGAFAVANGRQSCALLRDKFPDLEDPMTATTLSEGSASRSSVPTITVGDPKGSKMATKRLLGGLSSDKEFLASLVNRRSLTRELQSTFSNGPVGKSGIQVAAVAKEALSSLQHLESFMWQRDPGGSMNTGGDKTTLQKSREKKEKARVKASLRKRVATILQKLQQEEDLEATVREGETLVNEVKATEVGDRILCRLLVGVGVALPKCGRPQDAIAVLTDAVHIARANEYGEEEHSAVEQLGRVLAEQGQHAEAVAVWERRIPAAANSAQRASLFLLIAKSYFAMRKVETGKFYGTKSVREADDDQDNTTALTALLALIDADVQQENIEGAQKNLEKCGPLLEDAPQNLLDEYESYKVKISQFTEETPS
ncbi:outer dynein arm-docking complex subunit 4-like isoform X4 [Macrobrachium nipponense]|uniref:outer dynein arm-docking complex subunit 4-like isoform X4 n=1 Tax=Macrobrachium nipponense TaxID=159736 RepID=UPI0030C867F9